VKSKDSLPNNVECAAIDPNEKWFDAEKISTMIPVTKLPAGLYVTGMPQGNGKSVRYTYLFIFFFPFSCVF
jgi:hypothetical protein